ncbi:hybrid sensor histidine kinase/response regulator [Leptothoe sp. PORK10 BA2]|uniref:hybrid sensor histidine kinase/response regulator n=1 Tax=Leptothoe sp. PORK10 BA2 TaxID=3110254 RepID=UPI002B1FAF28|nr:response regulator [Leptothoe sp. PORK10 BA2]MEA5464961.1 response regulator [Leptothoe sp. PORK10 BA2]
MKPQNILVIDDDVSHFDVIDALFNHQGYQLYYASSGEDAISSLDAFNPDLILLDVLMPGMNGVEVCRCIKALPQWQNVPIIILTILDTKTTVKSCVQAGADDFITKPFDLSRLRTRVHSMLKIKQQHNEYKTLSRIQTNTVNLLESTLDELRGNLASQLSHDDLLNRIEQSACRLETLTAKFQIYMELELAANQPIPFQASDPQSLTVVVEELAVLAQRYNRSHDLRVTIEDTNVAVSARYLSIIFHELVDNALKFSSSGTLIEVRSDVAEDCVTLSIHDSGQGISVEKMASIDDSIQFERRVYKQKNDGMGLKIIKRIVALVGGQLEIKNNYPQGTIVQIALPIACS